MDAITKKRALLAAMKATLTAGATLGALACGTAAEPVAAEDTYKKDVPCDSLDGAVSDSATVDARGTADSARATTTCEVETNDAGFSKKTRLCCTALLSGDFADGGEGWVTLSDTSDHLACCHSIIQGYYPRFFDGDDAGALPSPAESRAFNACCQTYQRWDGTSQLSQEEMSTCSPWGPPMPPAMPRRIA